MWSELAVALQRGNAYVIIILAFAFLSCVVIFERLIMLQLVYHINFKKFISELKKMIIADDKQRAISLCKNTSHTSLPQITLKAVEASEVDPTTVKGVIEESSLDFLPKLEQRLSFLPAAATVILLIGILGTIDGLWKAFHSLDVLDSTQKQVLLAQGVAQSLNPTALGLIASIFILVAYQFLRSLALKLVDKIHHGVSVLNHLLIPQDIMFAASAGPQQVEMASAPSQQTLSAPLPQGKSPANAAAVQQEGFDDVIPEDIKDEEEII